MSLQPGPDDAPDDSALTPRPEDPPAGAQSPASPPEGSGPEAPGGWEGDSAAPASGAPAPPPPAPGGSVPPPAAPGWTGPAPEAGYGRQGQGSWAAPPPAQQPYGQPGPDAWTAPPPAPPAQPGETWGAPPAQAGPSPDTWGAPPPAPAGQGPQGWGPPPPYPPGSPAAESAYGAAAGYPQGPDQPAPGYGYPPGGYQAGPAATGYGVSGYGTPRQTDSKAVVALVLAIASWVLCPVLPAIAALILAGQSNRAIDASYGRLEGRSMNTATKWVSWANIVLVTLGVLLTVVVLAFAATTGSISLDDSTQF